MKIIQIICILSLSFCSNALFSANLPGIPEFIDEMVEKHQFKRSELDSVFRHAKHLPSVVELISRPPKSRPWLEYRASFVNKERIRRGVKFWQKYRKALQRAERKYGVPQEIILAVIGVETVYGRNAGNIRALDALTTLAFDYPRRADFFRSELENYLLLARDQEFDLLTIRGSYAGALGVPQFMPSSYRNYAVDFNGDSTVDLLNQTEDAIGSVANYLKGYGWISGKDIVLQTKISGDQPLEAIGASRTLATWHAAGVQTSDRADQHEAARLVDYTIDGGKEFWLALNNFEVITRYNNSDYYAMSVYQLAEAVKAAKNINASK
ncbi:MAG: lytic murein transglycosylase B [Gallionella sp.]